MPLPQVTEAQKELASQAMSEFDKKQYGSCCSLMHKLIAQRPTDPKVAHNKAVAEFYQSGFLTTDEFRQQLSKVCQMVCHEYFGDFFFFFFNVLFLNFSFIKITGIRTSSFILLYHEQQIFFFDIYSICNTRNGRSFIKFLFELLGSCQHRQQRKPGRC